MYQTVFLRSKRIWISLLFYTTMGISHRTSREEYHTLFISSVYGAFSQKDTSQRHTWTHYGNKSTEWNYCFPQNFIRAWPRMCSTFGYTMFFPSGNRIGWHSESRACTKYGIKLHRRTVAKTKRRLSFNKTTDKVCSFRGWWLIYMSKLWDRYEPFCLCITCANLCSPGT